MKYIIITNGRRYFAVDPVTHRVGQNWKSTIPEAIQGLCNTQWSFPDHSIFSYLKVSDSGEYFIEDADHYTLHSIIDSDINPEYFI